MKENPTIQAAALPEELQATGTIPEPTWRRANRREIALWVGAGFAGGVLATTAIGLTTIALTTGALA